jgi:hypothetical protein
LQNALKSGDQTSVQSAFQTLQDDLSSVKGNSHHHHHHKQADQTSAATSTTSPSSSNTTVTNTTGKNVNTVV